MNIYITNYRSGVKEKNIDNLSFSDRENSFTHKMLTFTQRKADWLVKSVRPITPGRPHVGAPGNQAWS